MSSFRNSVGLGKAGDQGFAEDIPYKACACGLADNFLLAVTSLADNCTNIEGD